MRRRLLWILCVAMNVALFAVFGLVIGLYTHDYRAESESAHRSEVQSLASSVASIDEIFYENQVVRLDNVVQLLQHRSFDLDATAVFLSEINSETNSNYQIVTRAGTGFSSTTDDSGTNRVVNYTHLSYNALDDVFAGNGSEEGGYLPEFTDYITKLKSVAAYRYVTVKDAGGNDVPCTLLCVYSQKYIVSMVTAQSSFSGLATALVDVDGNYIFSSLKFKSDNVYDYIAQYNDLGLTEKNDLNDQVKLGTRTFIYTDSDTNECMFAFSPVSNYGWYAVIAVPTAELSSSNTSMVFTVEVAAILFAIFIANLVVIFIINRDLRASKAQAERASRAKTDFLSRVSHDMRTPMNGIISMSKFVEDCSTIEEAKEYNKKIMDSGKYLLMLINDTLDMNRIESGRLELSYEKTSGKKLMQSIIAEITPLAREKDVNLVTRASGINWGMYMLDKLRFKQVLMNLISNAIKFTPAGGTVTLEIKCTGRVGNMAFFDIFVIDTGIGMSPAFLKEMYTPFVQEVTKVSSQYTGSGLGLSIVKRIVELSGGSIECTSEVGKGTTFVVHMQCEKVAEQDEEDLAIKDEDIRLDDKYFLIVEDNEINQMIAEMLLERRGAKFDVAANGQIAVDMFAASPLGKYDAILMDLRMPVMDGTTATTKIRAMSRSDSKTIPIIATTADAFSDDMKKTQAAGMNAHLTKPIDADVMYRTLYEMTKVKYDY